MFDIGWSEFVLIAVVALIAIGPKELPGVLRMVGQWMGKARKMAAEFQSQFQEAMREAEMADLKKSFDEVREAASGFSPAGMISSLQQDVSNSLRIEPLDKPTDIKPEAKQAPAAAAEVTAAETPAAVEAPAVVDTAAVAVEAEAKTAPAAQANELQADELKDAKAS
jgi:sec-independent protein translocase protein TatB